MNDSHLTDMKCTRHCLAYMAVLMMLLRLTTAIVTSQRTSVQSNISGDTVDVHLSDLGTKQIFTKT